MIQKVLDLRIHVDIEDTDYDMEAGFYYLQSRYYNPECARFLNIYTTSVLQLTNNHILGINFLLIV